MTPIIRTPIDSRSVWKAADIRSKDELCFDLERRHTDCLARAVERLRAAGGAAVEDIDRLGFDLSPIAEDLDRWLAEVRDGRGLLILRGFPVEEHSLDDIVLMFAGIGRQWGVTTSQSATGERVGHVIAVDRVLVGERKRAYKGTHEMQLHNDFCDILGMFCVRPAQAGGESRYASGSAIYNEILRTRPDYLEPLYNGFHYWRIGESAREPVTPHRVPVYASRDGVVSMQYQENWEFLKPERTGVPVTPFEIEARDYFAQIAESPEFRWECRMEAGECAWINNLIILHSRGEVHNDPSDPGRRRHVMRLWVDCNPGFRPAVPELQIYPHKIGIPPDASLVHERGGGL